MNAARARRAHCYGPAGKRGNAAARHAAKSRTSESGSAATSGAASWLQRARALPGPGILSRYVAFSLMRGWAAVLLGAMAVFALLAYIQELEHAARLYHAGSAARFILLTLPQQIATLAPVIVLLGSILALAGLNRSNELTVMCAAGLPLGKLLQAVAVPTLALMACLWLAMEYIAAPLHLDAETQRWNLRHNHDIRIPDGGVWSRQGKRYIHLAEMHAGGVPGDINVFEFDDDGRLLLALHAQTAEIRPERKWLLKDVQRKARAGEQLTNRQLDSLEIDNLWAAAEVPSLPLSSHTMTLSVLYRYSQFLESNGQPNRRYLDAFWQKLAMPFTAAAMVLLAVPVSVGPGSLRERRFGLSLAGGALLGIFFYLSAQIVFALGQLLAAPPMAVALSPAVVVGAAAMLWLRRVRW